MLRPSSLPHARAVQVCGAVLAAGVLLLSAAAPSAAAHGPAGTHATVTRSPVAERAVARGAAGAVVRAASPRQPLVPKIRSIFPDYVPDKGPIVIRGTVTNDSHRTWTAINVHGFMGSTPITSSAELAATMRTPLTADVGHRITVPGTFATIHSLAPGETATFRITLPHNTLPVSSPGVYWFGVHVLGDNGEGGPREAVGRDRTFLAYVPASVAQGAQEQVALVLPVRAPVTHGPDGSVEDPESWGQSLRSGMLHDVAQTGAAAGGRPLTWLLDPAVTDVARRLAQGNPARQLGPPAKGGKDSPTPSDSPSSSSTGSGASASVAGSTPSAATRTAAKSWLQQMRTLLGAGGEEVLGLPFGDLAVEPAVEHDQSLLRAAFRRTAQAMSAWSLPEAPVVAPPTGRTTAGTVAGLPRAADVLLADTGVSDASHTLNRVAGHHVVLESTATTDGGPGPVDSHSSLAFRQRVMAEAALRVLDDRQPLVVELPAGVQRRIHPSLFSGLDAPWLRLATLDEVSAGTPSALDPDQLRPVPDDQPTLGSRLYGAADDLLAKGRTLQSVLADGHALERRLFEEVTANASYAAQKEPYIALSRMRVIDSWVRSSLSGIDVAAPQSVTLASASGHFSVLLSNDLDVPVTVRVHARTDPHVTITGGDDVVLPPHGRKSVLLNATTHQRGVHNVVLELTSPDGQPLGLGSSDPFPMRAEQVSGLIWVIIGVGVGLLFAAILVRLTRRILRARSS
ncbi:MAG: DUF6049 family protein [Nocardioides sp.]